MLPQHGAVHAQRSFVIAQEFDHVWPCPTTVRVVAIATVIIFIVNGKKIILGGSSSGG